MSQQLHTYCLDQWDYGFQSPPVTSLLIASPLSEFFLKIPEPSNTYYVLNIIIAWYLRNWWTLKIQVFQDVRRDVLMPPTGTPKRFPPFWTIVVPSSRSSSPRTGMLQCVWLYASHIENPILLVMSHNFRATNYVHIEFSPSSITQDAMKMYGKANVYSTHSLNLALEINSTVSTSSKYAHKHATRFYNY